MFRLLFVAFLGPARSSGPAHAAESPGVMTIPLVLLTLPTVLAGLWGIDRVFNRQFGTGEAEHAGGLMEQFFAPLSYAPVAAVAGIGAVLFGFFLAWTLYRDANVDPLPEKLGKLARGMRNRFYFDEIYDALIGITQEFLASVAEFIDRWVIAGLFVRGVHGTTEILGRALRLVQTGNLQGYAFLFVAGLVVILFLALAR